MRHQMTPIAERFWKHVVKRGDDDCWGWEGSTCKGYGQLGKGRVGEGLIYAHRLSWIIHFGPIPDGMHVCHKCDNPPCTNPRHLFLGTAKDNTQDMIKKGRKVIGDLSGENNGCSILTEKDVLEIRRLRLEGMKLSELADKFGVNKPAIGHVVSGLNWGHTEGALTPEERKEIDRKNKRGEKHSRSRLTEEDVRKIRTRGDAGENQHHIARDFGIAPSTINKIVKRKGWAHVQ